MINKIDKSLAKLTEKEDSNKVRNKREDIKETTERRRVIRDCCT